MDEMHSKADQELEKVISYLSVRGYVIESDAVEALKSLSEDLEKIVQNVIEAKKSSGNDNVIRIQDVTPFIPIKRIFTGVAIETEVETVSDPSRNIQPLKPLEGYSKLFVDRYNKLLSLLRRRPDSKGLTSIGLVGKFSEGSKVKTAGLLFARSERKSGVEVTLDDPSGSVRVYFKEALAQQVLKVPLDSMVMIEGTKVGVSQILASRVSLPDVPDHKPTVSSHRAYVVLLSDLHVGSKMFLEQDFARFLKWLNLADGDEDIVSKIKYIIIAGDLIDGIGIYPDQEVQLAEREPRKQYAEVFNLLSKVPNNIRIIISPGNHDMVRQALPQPAIPSDLAQPLYSMDNVTFVGSPAYLKINGVLFLIFHGRSLDDIIASTPELSYRRPSEAMKLLLRARHLAPIYGRRTALSPESQDMLVIEELPDVMHCGHVHAFDYQEYKGTLLVNSGTFQGQTPFQQNMGLEPTPSIVPILDLSSLEVIRRSFTLQSSNSILR